MGEHGDLLSSPSNILLYPHPRKSPSLSGLLLFIRQAIKADSISDRIAGLAAGSQSSQSSQDQDDQAKNHSQPQDQPQETSCSWGGEAGRRYRGRAGTRHGLPQLPALTLPPEGILPLLGCCQLWMSRGPSTTSSSSTTGSRREDTRALMSSSGHLAPPGTLSSHHPAQSERSQLHQMQNPINLPGWEERSLRERPPRQREGAWSLLESPPEGQRRASQQEHTSRGPSTGTQLQESPVTSPPFVRDPSHASGSQGEAPSPPGTHRLLALSKEQALFRASGAWSAREAFRWQVM